jgi:hypothetical protein
MNRTRRVRVRVPNFFAAVEIAARSDLVMTLLSSLAQTAAGWDASLRCRRPSTSAVSQSASPGTRVTRTRPGTGGHGDDRLRRYHHPEGRKA